jgi:hypothetical protein
MKLENLIVYGSVEFAGIASDDITKEKFVKTPNFQQHKKG